ncbi:unnamed protein product [Prunus armeniaca]
MVVILLLLFLLAPCASSLSFSFPSFTNDDINNLSLEGDASLDGSLRLTKSLADQVQDQSVSRATYSQPFLLRNNTTGKLADFTTNFTFSIDSLGNTTYADGLAFFLAPKGSALNTTIGRGGSLGLPVIHLGPNESTNLYPFVAVEFDIYQNSGDNIDDPRGDHVGIDVNSVKSKVTRAWNGSITQGRVNSASIRYDSGSKNLSITFTTYENGVWVERYLDYKVDLNEILQGWVIVGFSAATGRITALHKINSWSFNSTSLIDNTPVAPEPTPNVEPKSSGSANIRLFIGLGGGGFLILVGGLCLAWFTFWKRRRVAGERDENPFVNKLIHEELEKGTGPRKFSYRELVRATSNFEEGEKLGEGGFGGVYRGFIKELNSYVAVKRISSGSKQGLKEYAAEVRIISRLRHRNLVQLIGWCHEKQELMLVYDFMPNGSLDSHLFKEKGLLTWQLRYSIAQGLASGLFYLHEEWEQCVLHRDIKSSNVMLDSNFNAKLGDFGLARLVDHGKQSQTTIVAGTRGYMALEYVTTGKASKESDIYSFGVVALEIACGRKPIDLSLESGQIEMVEWVWELYGEGTLIQAADPKLCGHFDEKQMECLMIVGLWCAHPDYKFRPSIQQAIQVLKFEVPLPILPSKMPMATYFAPRTSLSTVTTDTTSSERGQTESHDTVITPIPHNSPHLLQQNSSPSTTFQSPQ